MMLPSHCSFRYMFSGVCVVLAFQAVLLDGVSDVRAGTLPSVKIATAPLISPSAADAHYGSSLIHTFDTNFGFGAGSSNPRPPEIVELARALKHDPDLIFEYVHNTIRVNFSYGLQKGALGAIIDHSGTTFDQAHLFAELMRQSGYTVSYQVGAISLTGAQFYDWAGLSNAKAACQFLAAGGMPAVVNGSTQADCNYSGTITSVQLGHIWVEATIGGQAYLFDPSYKRHQFKSGINLASAMQYSTGSALSQAMSGTYSQGVETSAGLSANWVKELGSIGIKALSTNLLTYLRQNLPDAEMEDVVGGGRIIRINVPSGGFRSSSLPYPVSLSRTWTGDIPNLYRSYLTISAKDPSRSDATVIFHTLRADEVYGRRVRIETNFDWETAQRTDNVLWATDGFKIWLAVDGVRVSPEYATTISQATYRYRRQLDVILEADHPYAANYGMYADQAVSGRIYAATPVSIFNGWGDVSQNLVAKWNSEVADDRVAPRQNTSKLCSSGHQPLPVTGCTTNKPSPAGDFLRDKMVATWLGQFSRLLDLNARVARSAAQHHHSIGFSYSDQWSRVVNQEFNAECSGTGCIWGIPDEFNVLDVSSTISVTHAEADSAVRRGAIYTVAALGAALEGDVSVQLLNIPSVASTASRFSFANSIASSEGSFEAPWGEREWLPGFQDDLSPRRFYSFFGTSALMSGNVLTYLGRTSNYPAYDPRDAGRSLWYPSDIQAWKDALRNSIVNYTQDGFSVVASSESFSGPGATYTPSIVYDYRDSFDQEGNPVRVAASYQEQPKTRGGALVAVKTDGSGNPTDIAHVVNNLTGSRKGGGAGAPSAAMAALTADGAANLLRSRFSDRSNVLGVDLRSGKAGYATGSLLSLGNGSFPEQFTTSLIYTGPGTQEASFWHPDLSLAATTYPTPFRGFTTNWDARLQHFTDAFEAMGATSVLPATTAIATMVAMQDLYRAGTVSTSGHTWAATHAAGPMAFRTWHEENNHNVVTVSHGGNVRKFIRLVDGTFVSPKGDASVLTQTNRRIVRLPACYDRFSDSQGSQHYMVYANMYGYDIDHSSNYPDVTFSLRNPQGDVQSFKRWRTKIGCRIVGGWNLHEWTFPHGQTLRFDFRDGGALDNVTLVAPQSTGPGAARSIAFSSSVNTAQANFEIGGIFLNENTGRQFHTRIYDAFGREVTLDVEPFAKINHLNGGVTRFEYCAPAQRSATQRPMPFPQLCKIYTPSSATSPVLHFSYDSVGSVKEVRDAVAIATPATRGPYKFYIADGTRGEREDPMTPNTGRYVVQYDESGRAVSHTDELGRKVVTEYDAHHRVTKRLYPEGDEERFSYDPRHNVIEFRRKSKPGSGLADAVVHAAWDAAWNKPTSIADALGRTTVLAYYGEGAVGAGLLREVRRPAATQGGPQPSWTFEYLSGSSLVTRETSPGAGGGASIASTHSYVNGYRTQTVVDTQTGGLNLTSQWQYNQYGDVIRQRDPRGYVTEFTYFDASGAMSTTAGVTRRLAETRSSSHSVAAIGDAVSGWLNVARKVYDVEGRVIRDEAPASITGTTYSWTNPLVLGTTTYSPAGKVVSVADASGDTTTTSYDALDRADVVTEPVGRKVKTVYDAAGQVTQVIRGFGSPLQQIYSTAVYSPNGQVLSVTDARGQITKSVYDGFDRLSKVLYPDTTPANDNDNLYEQFSYDSGSRKLTERKRGGQVVSFSYDDLDRVVSRSGGGLPVRSMTYDLGSRVTSVKDMNGATVVAETQYAFDTAGRLTQERRADWSLNVDYQYDANGNRTRLTWPDGFYASYAYDGLNRVTAVASPTLSLKTFAYDHLSRRASAVTMPGASQTVTTFGYEPDNDLRYLTHNYPGTTVDLKYTHTYSASGRVLTSSASEALNRYVPPALHGTQTYASANPLNQYPSVTPIGGAAQIFAHDLNGNLTSDGATTFSYDATNRLLSIAGASSASYGYDALDRRVTKTVGAAVTRFLHAGGDEIADYSSAGALLRRYVPGPGTDERVAMIDSGLASPPATSITYPHTDRLGTVVSVTGSTGAVTQRFTYDAYGRSSSAATGYPFRFTGQRFDAESGLMFYKARVYSTSLGRFLQTDPIGTKDDMNMYAYVGNDPVNATDPSGQSAGSQMFYAPLSGSWMTECRNASSGCYDAAGQIALRDGGNLPGIGGPLQFTAGVLYGDDADVSLGAFHTVADVFTLGSASIANTIYSTSARIGANAVAVDVASAFGGRIGSVDMPPGLMFGTTEFGDAAHRGIGNWLSSNYPDTQFKLNILPGQRGVDIEVLRGTQPFGTKYMEIKPRSPSGLLSYKQQVNKWGLEGHVTPLTYDSRGNFYNGFF